MAYKSVFVPNPIELEYKGITIYGIYKDDDADCGVIRTYLYGLNPDSSDCCNEADIFDVRQSRTTTFGGEPLKIPYHYTEGISIDDNLKAMIDLGVFSEPAPAVTIYKPFQLIRVYNGMIGVLSYHKKLKEAQDAMRQDIANCYGSETFELFEKKNKEKEGSEWGVGDLVAWVGDNYTYQIVDISKQDQ
jgi:hypothetical protein